MPYPNEHAARFLDPHTSYIKSIRRQNDRFGKGIDAIWAVPKDVDTHTLDLQAIRFRADRYSPAQARTWLKRHGMWSRVIKFEPARGHTNPTSPSIAPIMEAMHSMAREERQGVRDYEKLYDMVDAPHYAILRREIAKILRDEVEHYRVLTNLIHQYR